MTKPALQGVAAVLLAVVLWGVQLPVAKLAFVSVDPYHVTGIRYGIAMLCLIPLLVWHQGARALRYRGRFWAVSAIGVIGMCISPMLTFVGLSYSRPEHAAIISALQPMMVAIGLWWFKARRPSAFTLACIAIAFIGVFIVVTAGKPVHPAGPNELFGDLLIFGGAVAWVSFAMMSERFKDWTALSFTTLTIIPGTLATFLLLGIAGAADLVSLPAPAAIASVVWQLLYLSFGSVILAMFCWNMGNQRIGPLNAMLFINLQPVVTFVVQFVQGYRFAAVELAGAALVIGALFANSLYLRSMSLGRRDIRC